MGEPDNLVLALLRELRSETNAVRGDMGARFETRMEARFAAVERWLHMMHRNGKKPLRGFTGHRAMARASRARSHA